MADPSQDSEIVYEHWSPLQPAQSLPEQPLQHQWTTSLPFHHQPMQWESQDSSTEQGGIADSQGGEDPSQWTQSQWISSQSSYSTDYSSQQDASSFAAAPFASQADAFAQPLLYAEHHQYAEEAFTPYQTKTHIPLHDPVDPRFPSQRFMSHAAIVPIAGEEQMMAGMGGQGWYQQHYDTQEYSTMDTEVVADNNSVASSPKDQFAFAGTQQSYEQSPQLQGFGFHAQQGHYQQYDRTIYPEPILTPTSSSSAFSLHTPSSSLSSFAYPSNPTSPAYSQPQPRSRQHSLDSGPPSTSARPQPLRRLSQSGASSRLIPSHPHPYANAVPTRPVLTSSRSSSSLPTSRRGSINLPPSTVIRSTQQQRGTSPSESRHPRRRASQPSLSIFTPTTAPISHRRPFASASSSPIHSRFGSKPLPFSALATRATFHQPLPPPGTIKEKPPPPCSMFDPPLVRRFGRLGLQEVGGGGWERGRAEEVLSSEIVGLGLEMGDFMQDEAAGLELVQLGTEEERKLHPPAMSEALFKETVNYLQEPNKLAMGERSLLIFSPKVIHPSSEGERFKLFPQPTALLLGLNWFSEAREQDPSARHSSRLVPPHLHFSTTLQNIISSPEASSTSMAQDGMLVEGGSILGGREQVLAVRATGEGVETPDWSVGEGEKRVYAAVVVDGLDTAEERVLGVFPGPEMKFASAADTGEIIHHGSLVAISNRMKDSLGYPLFLAVSGTASSFPTIDWRAMTGGTPRTYKFARSEFTARSNAWDSLIIYAVDPERKEREETGEKEKMKAFRAGYPAPPPGVLPFDPLAPSAIRYNQPIVLQCMSTAAVSPILLIRRHHSQSLVVGGSSLTTSSLSSTSHLIEETHGATVSSHLPLAFEFADLSSGFAPGFGGTGGQDIFLEGMEGIVAHRQATGGRMYVDPEELERGKVEPAPTLAQVRRPRALGQTSSQPFAAAGGSEAPTSVYSRSGRMDSPTSTRAAFGGSATETGGAKGLRRRVQSMSSFKPFTEDRRLGTSARERGNEQNTWMIDCGDSCIWSIVPVDVARHTFYIPPSTLGTQPVKIRYFRAKHSIAGSTLLPSTTLGPTIPTVHEFDPPTTSSPWITLYGANFTPGLSIWISTYRSPSYVLRSAEVILVPPPPKTVPDTPVPRGSVGGERIAIGREDGVLWMTNVMYREAGM